MARFSNFFFFFHDDESERVTRDLLKKKKRSPYLLVLPCMPRILLSSTTAKILLGMGSPRAYAGYPNRTRLLLSLLDSSPGGTSPSKVMPGYTGPSNGIMPSTGTPASPAAGVIKTGACTGLSLPRLLSLSLPAHAPRCRLAYGGALRRAVLAIVLLIILCRALRRRRLLQASAVAPQLAPGHRRARAEWAQTQGRW